MEDGRVTTLVGIFRLKKVVPAKIKYLDMVLQHVGFIRAEFISFKDFMKCGSMAEVKKRGPLRLEGKTFIVQDGDIITILFNV